MSASTVSITANPGTRRRSAVVVSTEKSKNIELISAEPQHKAGDDKSTTGNGRDLSHHSIRGEAILERTSRDAVQTKKTTSTVSPPVTTTARRSRKVASPKPRWVTVLSVFTKNFLLLILLAGLVQIVRRFALRSEDGGEGPPLAFSDFEGRIAEIEKLFKSTTRMMQVQVEVVDRKIDNEVGGLREEVGKMIEEKGSVLDNRLIELESKGEALERSLGELKDVNWLSKEEFDKIYEQLQKKVTGDDAGKGEASLNDIRVYARDAVLKEIEKHAADGLGRVDYALASGGAMVVRHSEPYVVVKGSNWFPMSARNGVNNDARKMLNPSFGEPGQCFALKGSSGFVEIRLRTAIIPEAVTLEHVAKSVAFDRSSAPKNCRISGWLQEHNIEWSYDSEKMFLLAEFSYDLEKSNAQTFNVLESAGSNVVDTIRFDFTSNHGSPSHTCIYRLRMHGHEPYSVSMMPMQS
ncbi:SUN domain-containing protein 1-like [Humulus lupulus]|uniref:SUN domain-containing protein 1-like n=1 Tax=Humulus lupulus TaxID=3486 RepID=UPI002B40C5E0|nr:SUN domain-containing protein 1-like [Humulus lupulus]